MNAVAAPLLPNPPTLSVTPTNGPGSEQSILTVGELRYATVAIPPRGRVEVLIEHADGTRTIAPAVEVVEREGDGEGKAKRDARRVRRPMIMLRVREQDARPA